MKKYRVTIEETISQDFEVEAENLDEAIDKTIEKYKSGEFVLDENMKTNKKQRKL